LVLAHEHPLLILANPRLALGLLQRSYAGAEDLQTTTGDLIGPPPNQFTVIDQDIGSTAT
ncbi:MAG TPA: hypothetical protein VFW94_14410, partial [Candidatus Acidoferrales bacterium]|nr:hypothetical protein [Candidatus Acidoferrales bacterium]